MTKVSKLLTLSLVLISAPLVGCGDNSKDDEAVTEITPPVTKTFTVSVTDIQATQTSTGKAITVDIDSVSQTGTLTVQ
ncbi:hypothetical protein [Pseudoalteromonas sp. T1lg48]|uniref:hypothetical protein n=1 Tax=Pseudoalteromonas sp. T1lg48 TaxID=2077100 RepID=UPI000CF62444|nr:hypothetical protein [Pseudoalteromonas sp. T1lg48]